MLMPLTREKCLGEKQNANNAIWKIKYDYLVLGEVQELAQATWVGSV